MVPCLQLSPAVGDGKYRPVIAFRGGRRLGDVRIGFFRDVPRRVQRGAASHERGVFLPSAYQPVEQADIGGEIIYPSVEADGIEYNHFRQHLFSH